MIVVMTPTGNIGHHVALHLLDANEAVRVVVRDAEKLAQTVRDRAEIAGNSPGDAAVIDPAFDGAEAVFWIAPPSPSEALDDTYINFTRPGGGGDPPSPGRARRRGNRTRTRHRVGGSRGAGHCLDPDGRPLERDPRRGSRPRHAGLHGKRASAGRRDQAGQMFGPLDPDKKVPQ